MKVVVVVVDTPKVPMVADAVGDAVDADDVPEIGVSTARTSCFRLRSCLRSQILCLVAFDTNLILVHINTRAGPLRGLLRIL